MSHVLQATTGTLGPAAAGGCSLPGALGAFDISGFRLRFHRGGRGSKAGRADDIFFGSVVF